MLTVYGDLYFQPPVPALLAVAGATSSIALGPRASTRTRSTRSRSRGRWPHSDAASSGRAFLGLARGSWLGDLGIDQSHAPEAVAEAATIVAALLKGDRRGVAGERFVLPRGPHSVNGR